MTYRAPRADHGQAVVGLLAGGYLPPWAPWTDGDVLTEELLQAAGSAARPVTPAGAVPQGSQGTWCSPPKPSNF
jgi:hypothetical protein